MHNDHNLRQKLREYKRTPGSFILMPVSYTHLTLPTN